MTTVAAPETFPAIEAGLFNKPFLDTVLERRSVKHFDPDYKLSDRDVHQLIGLAMYSPTSFNIQNWRFVCVRDPQVKAQLRQAAWDQAQVTEASLVVVMCADLKSWDKSPSNYWRLAPQPVQDVLVPMIQPFYRDDVQKQRDEAMRSVGLAGQTLMLGAKAMGLDSCPMIGFDQDAVAKIINLPEDHVVGFMITVGKAKKPANPRGGPIPLETALIHERFS